MEDCLDGDIGKLVMERIVGIAYRTNNKTIARLVSSIVVILVSKAQLTDLSPLHIDTYNPNNPTEVHTHLTIVL